MYSFDLIRNRYEKGNSFSTLLIKIKSRNLGENCKNYFKLLKIAANQNKSRSVIQKTKVLGAGHAQLLISGGQSIEAK